MTPDPLPAPEAPRQPARPLTLRRALVRVASVVVVVAAVLVVGAANGVGPLARVTPPSEVTDPREMLARSLQAVLDASSLHVDFVVTGHVPGALVGRPDASVTLDGTSASLDVRPQDARSHLVVTSVPLGVNLEAVTLWDTLAFRTAGGTWAKVSLGSVVGSSGIDANPLTMVDRLRAWLASPGAPVPTSTDVPCATYPGTCHEVRLAAGAQPGEVLLRLFPEADAAQIGPTTTDVVLQTDATTLQPAKLTVTTRNADGSLAVTVVATTSYWNWPSVIPDPPGG